MVTIYVVNRFSKIVYTRRFRFRLQWVQLGIRTDFYPYFTIVRNNIWYNHLRNKLILFVVITEYSLVNNYLCKRQLYLLQRIRHN